MRIEAMHYDFKMKFNKIDSQSNRNFKVPEIDWLLNEAAEIFVKMIAEPRIRKELGFETSQRTLEDIASIVVSNDNDWSSVTNNVLTLPDDYWYLIKGRIKVTKGVCKNIVARFHLTQHDDMNEEKPLYKSSFEWRRFNAHRFDGGIKFFDDGIFTITDGCINYIRRMSFMHNANAYVNNTYISAEGVTLTGTEDCELPVTTHSEIVDIAVLLASGNIQTSDYQVKLNKLKLNELT